MRLTGDAAEASCETTPSSGAQRYCAHLAAKLMKRCSFRNKHANSSLVTVTHRKQVRRIFPAIIEHVQSGEASSSNYIIGRWAEMSSLAVFLGLG